MFFKKYKDKPPRWRGIYLIQFTEDPSIYYIGRSKNFQTRLNIHLRTTVKDKFHLFANLVGCLRRCKFSFAIIEICDLNVQLGTGCREKIFIYNAGGSIYLY